MTTSAPPMLRPLGAGERIDAGIKLYLRSFRALAPALLAIAVPVAVVDGALSAWTATTLRATPILVTNPDGTRTFHSSALSGLIGVAVITFVVALVLGVPGKAIAFRAYSNVYLGRPMTWRGVLNEGLRRVVSLLWISVIVNGLALVAIGCFVLVILALVPLHALAVVLLVAPGVMLFCFEVWWSVSCRLAAPSLMLEDLRGIGAVRRSVTLVRGTWWSVFGTVLLAALLVGVVSRVAAGVLSLLVSVGVSTSDVGNHAFFTTLLTELVTIVVFVPLSCAVATVLAVDMRVRKEGLDLAMLTDGLGDGAPKGSYDFLPRPRATFAPGQPPGPWPPAPGSTDAWPPRGP